MAWKSCQRILGTDLADYARLLVKFTQWKEKIRSIRSPNPLTVILNNVESPQVRLSQIVCFGGRTRGGVEPPLLF
jgi:hypothetical protein